MPTAYKNPRGQDAVRRWCSEARADFPLTSAAVDTSAGRVQLTSAGTGRPRVFMVPGTASNAAVALQWLRALSARWATMVVDLPGQPGHSDPRRPRRGRLDWCGRLLDEVLAVVEADEVVLVGNSLGRGGPVRRLAQQMQVAVGACLTVRTPRRLAADTGDN